MRKKETDIRDVALRKLSHKARTCGELETALISAGFSKEKIDKLIDEFKSLGYLDDVWYCMSFFEYGDRKGWADSRIIRELKNKGVSQNDLDDALEKLGKELNDRVRALEVALKMADVEDLEDSGRLKEKTKGRIARRLYGYGYSSDRIFATIQLLEEELNSEKD